MPIPSSYPFPFSLIFPSYPRTHANVKFYARKHGLIFSIGSFASAVPSPVLATYGILLATFPSAFAEEVRAHGCLAENLNTYFAPPLLRKTNGENCQPSFPSSPHPSVLIPTQSSYVRAVLSQIGLPCPAGSPTAQRRSSRTLLDYLMDGEAQGLVCALRKMEREM
jgi:hypothetical protein